MPTYPCAYIGLDNQDLLIVPLDDHFDAMSSAERASVAELFETKARAAGFAGVLIPVWRRKAALMGFLAPVTYHPFLQTLDIETVSGMINGKLSW